MKADDAYAAAGRFTAKWLVPSLHKNQVEWHDKKTSVMT
jgi:hypothetical protein